MNTLQVSALKIQFPEYAIMSDAFSVKPGEWCEIKAPSGFGKTTFIRAILGFQKMAGEIYLGEKRLDFKPVHERNFGVVFQDQLLFPHLNAWENAVFGIKLRHQVSESDRQKALDAFTALGIEARFNAPIQELSGGERQRLALIRATLFEPEVLILDEPFKGLDAHSTQLTLQYIQHFLSLHPIPVIWISHQGDVQMQGLQLIGGETHGQRHFRLIS